MTTSPVTIYAVCRCEYEDNGTKALFTTRELAEDLEAELNAKTPGGYEVVEYPLLDAKPARVKVFGRTSMVNNETGEVRALRSWDHETWDYELMAERAGDTTAWPLGWTTITAYGHSAERADELLASAIAERVSADA